MDRRKFMAAAGAGAAWALAGRSIGQMSSDAIEARARELLGQLTLDEKLNMMSGRERFSRHKQMSGWINAGLPFKSQGTAETPGVPRLKIPGVRFADGSRGIRFTGCTAFPVSMARGATWDPAMEERVGRAMGYEGRAYGANFFGGGCINLLRHPRWGRSQETFGEDPLHIGRMGTGMVQGVQRHMMCCTKHFACNNIDTSRQYVSVEVDQRTLREIYLPHFKACVDAGTASIMSAYNRIHGEYCSHSPWLLKGILKDEWGFPGYVVSDWGAVHDTELAANAGCDVELRVMAYYDWKLKLAVKSGRVPMTHIDDAVLRLIRTQLKWIHLEGSPGYDQSKCGGAEHAAIARECSEKSMVLLKNDNNVLPISLDEIKSLAVIGELAAIPNLGQHGSTDFTPAYVVTPLDGIVKAAGGSVRVRHEDGKDLSAAKKAARDADAVVIVAGLTWREEDEGSDRKDLLLPAAQEEMIKAVAAENKRTVVVLMTGGALVTENWIGAAPAVLVSWYPGMEGGNALANIIFGRVNPSGKLPMVWAKSESDLPWFDPKAREARYDLFHGYRYQDKNNLAPAFAYGHGLSYTSFKYGVPAAASDGDGVKVTVDVTNTGKTAGEEVAQLYVASPGSKVPRSPKELKGFAKVAVKPGETVAVEFRLSPSDLAYYDSEAGKWTTEALEYVALTGPSSRASDLQAAKFRLP